MTPHVSFMRKNASSLESDVFVGTSGYSYSYWKNRFYPDGLAAAERLAYYATQFNTVELNNTFYRFPTVKNLKKIADATPDEFRFSVKANKIITHTTRMKNAGDTIKEFTDIVYCGMGNKLSCILYQFPPSYSYSEERLDEILSALGSGYLRSVIEFRHESWWQPKVYKLLHENGITFCSVSFPGLPEDNITDGTVFYKRLHGVPDLFRSSYTTGQLKTIINDFPLGKPSFVYFNNTMFETGYTNAALLASLIGTSDF